MLGSWLPVSNFDMLGLGTPVIWLTCACVYPASIRAFFNRAGKVSLYMFVPPLCDFSTFAYFLTFDFGTFHGSIIAHFVLKWNIPKGIFLGGELR